MRAWLNWEMDLARGERPKCIKKRNIRLLFSVTSIITGIQLTLATNKGIILGRC